MRPYMCAIILGVSRKEFLLLCAEGKAMLSSRPSRASKHRLEIYGGFGPEVELVRSRDQVN